MVDNLGLGVLIQMLGGNKEAVQAIKDATGKSIVSLDIVDNRLLMGFTDDTALALYDNGQSCCEYRHIHTDDPLNDFVGAEFRGAELRDGPNENPSDYGDVKESQFLIIHTSVGDFTMVNYNEHNGYYGGFWITAEWLE